MTEFKKLLVKDNTKVITKTTPETRFWKKFKVCTYSVFLVLISEIISRQTHHFLTDTLLRLFVHVHCCRGIVNQYYYYRK